MFEKIRSLMRGSSAQQYRAYAERPTTRSTNIQAPQQRSGQGVVVAHRDQVLPMVRFAVRQDPHASALISKLVTATVGDGIALRSEATSPARNARIQSAFDDWAQAADTTRTLSLVECTQLIAREFFEAGEVLVRRRDTKDGVALEIVPAERCRVGHSDKPSSGNTVVDGVEFNADGAIVAYHLWPQPDEVLNTFSLTYLGKPERVPAEEIVHLYKPVRAGQFRGFPLLAPAIERLDVLHATLVALQERQEASAKFVAFTTVPQTDAGIVPLTGLAGTLDSDGQRYVVRLENSTVQNLAPGESIVFSDPPEPGLDGTAFAQFLLRGVCAVVNYPYELLLGDYGQSNDRVGRLIRLDAQREWTSVQYTYLGKALKRIYTWVLDDLQARHVIPQLGTDEYKVRINAPGFAYSHPVQEVQAAKLAIECGLLDRSTAAAEAGRNAEDIDRQQSFDNARAKALDLNYGPQPGANNTTEVE